jgi:hypothetical protein
MATQTIVEREGKRTVPSAKRVETMRALVFRGPNQIGIEKVPIPRPGYGEAVIRVTLTTICGTDVHILKGEYPVKPGLASMKSQKRTTFLPIAKMGCSRWRFGPERGRRKRLFAEEAVCNAITKAMS